MINLFIFLFIAISHFYHTANSAHPVTKKHRIAFSYRSYNILLNPKIRPKRSVYGVNKEAA
jgi:hypothetical protein